MEKIKLAVIFGGQSTEHNVSIVSGSSVLKNLNNTLKPSVYLVRIFLNLIHLRKNTLVFMYLTTKLYYQFI